MPKTTFAALAVLLGGCLLPGFTPAQQSSAPATSQAPASDPTPPSAPKPQKPPAGKPGTPETKSDSAPLNLQTQKDKVSYAVGLNLGKGIHKEAVDVDPDILARGMRDGLTDAKQQRTDEEVQATLTELQNQVVAHPQEMRQQNVDKNKKAGEAFLAANREKPGVIALPSGLQYKIVQAGTGPKPTAADTVVCNYRGTLVDGTEFDSSYKRGQAAAGCRSQASSPASGGKTSGCSAIEAAESVTESAGNFFSRNSTAGRGLDPSRLFLVVLDNPACYCTFNPFSK